MAYYNYSQSGGGEVFEATTVIVTKNENEKQKIKKILEKITDNSGIDRIDYSKPNQIKFNSINSFHSNIDSYAGEDSVFIQDTGIVIENFLREKGLKFDMFEKLIPVNPRYFDDGYMAYVVNNGNIEQEFEWLREEDMEGVWEEELGKPDEEIEWEEKWEYMNEENTEEEAKADKLFNMLIVSALPPDEKTEQNINNYFVEGNKKKLKIAHNSLCKDLNNNNNLSQLKGMAKAFGIKLNKKNKTELCADIGAHIIIYESGTTLGALKY